MKLARLATTVVAGACLAGGGTLAAVHATGVSKATLVSSSHSGFDSPRDVAENAGGPSPAVTDPDPTASPATTAPLPLGITAPTPKANGAGDGDNESTEAAEVDEANEPAESAEPADASDPDTAGEDNHDDGASQTSTLPADDHGGDNGGHSGDNNGRGSDSGS
jgi:hypothetical protein